MQFEEALTRSFPQGIGVPTMLVNILGITDDAKCYEMVRQLRWPDGPRCPHCGSTNLVKQGRDETEPQRQRYECRSCDRRFDDLTDTIFAGHHQPLRVWVLVLSFLGLNLSNEQIARELDLDPEVRLRILVIGVDKYKLAPEAGGYKELRHAASGARKVGDAFARYGGGLYTEVVPPTAR
jgi:transposase-like protein